MKEIQVYKFKRIIYLYDVFREGYRLSRDDYIRKFRICIRTFYRDLNLLEELTNYVIKSDGMTNPFFTRIKMR